MDIQELEGHAIETKFSLTRNVKKIMRFDDLSFLYSLMKRTFKLEEWVRSQVLWVRIQVLCLNWALFKTGRILRQTLNSLSLGDKNLLMPATRSQMKSDKEKQILISSFDQNCLVQLLSSFVLSFISASLLCFCKAHIEGIISESSCNGLGQFSLLC